MHTEITTPQERKDRYKERQIIRPRNAEHGKRMERDLRRLHLDFLRKKKPVLIP